MRELADHPSFSGQSKFRALVADTAAMSGEEKVNAYYQIVGIRNPKEVLEFIYARDNDSDRWSETLAKNAELGPEASSLITRLVRETIRPY